MKNGPLALREIQRRSITESTFIDHSWIVLLGLIFFFKLYLCYVCKAHEKSHLDCSIPELYANRLTNLRGVMAAPVVVATHKIKALAQNSGGFFLKFCS